MKLLVVAPNYPYPGHRFSGIFNKKSVFALSKLCDRVEVLSPRPYVPPLMSSIIPRWKAYANVEGFKAEDGISVYRPTTLVVPRVAQAFWADEGAFLWCRGTAKEMHRRARFDAIMSFGLIGAGGLAWRIARDLDIPASGWATGGDVRVPACSSHGRAVIRALKNLDIVFYQSRELMEHAASLLGASPEQLARDRHMILPRGIPEPPSLNFTQFRNALRAKWGIHREEVVLLYLGRVTREKGVFELLEAFELAIANDSRIICVLVGSKPAFDETPLVEKKVSENPRLKKRVLLLPECHPDKVWEHFSAADIFVFPSHHEGMPNSLLEAMAMGLPAIAFEIPPVRELEAGTGGLTLVPALDCRLFADAIVCLATAPGERKRIGEKAKTLVMDRFMVDKNMAEALRKIAQLRGNSVSSLKLETRQAAQA